MTRTTATDDAYADGLGELIEPATVIHPPPDMAVIIDKTAEHVHRVGRNFESRLQERQVANRRFGFLDETNPFHRYYKWRLQIFSRREAAEMAKEYDEEMKAQEERKKEERRKAELAEAQKQVHVVELTLKQKIEQEIKLLRKPKEAFVRPHAVLRYENSKFIVPRPSVISPLELDVIKLTAQVTSVAGSSFANELIAHEERNPLFAFLHPTSEHWQYFQLLLDAYKYVWTNHNHNNFEELQRLSKERIWDEAVGDAEWNNRENKKHDPEAEELERNANALIDWDDFVVLETIEIDPERDVLIPPGKTIKEINAILDVDRIDDEPIVALDNLNAEDMDLGSDSDDGDAPIIEMQQRRKGPTKAPRPAPSGFVVQETDTSARIETPADRQLRERLEEMLQSQRADAAEYQQCPVCKDEIAIAHLSEHIRIELLDPKWRDQKELLQQKMEDTSLAPNKEIAINLSEFSKKHAEQFRVQDQPKEPTKVAVQWDGHADTLAQNKAQAAVVDELRRKEEEKERKRQKESEAQKMASAPTAQGPQSIRPRLGEQNEAHRIPGSSMGGAPPRPANQMIPGGVPPPGGMPPMRMAQPFQPGYMYPGRPPMPGFPMYGAPAMPPMYPGMMVPGMVPPGMVRPGMVPPMNLAPGMRRPMPPRPPPPGARPGMVPPPPQSRLPASVAVSQGRLDAAPPAKRQKLDDGSAALVDPEDQQPAQQPPGSIPEADFLAQHMEKLRIRVVVPNDTDKHQKFNGQTLTFTMEPSDTIQILKERIETVIRFPANRQKLRIHENGFWVKNGSLAFYNIDGTSPLELLVKQRGGKK